MEAPCAPFQTFFSTPFFPPASPLGDSKLSCHCMDDIPLQWFQHLRMKRMNEYMNTQI